MAITGFPERVQSHKPVSELAERLGGALNETGAKSILEIEITEPSLERRRELAEKANEGSLTSEEFADYETYAQLGGLLAILQSKARICLQRQRRD